VSAGKREWKSLEPQLPCISLAGGQRSGLVTRYDIKEFLVNRFLPYAVQREVQVFQDSVNVLLCRCIAQGGWHFRWQATRRTLETAGQTGIRE